MKLLLIPKFIPGKLFSNEFKDITWEATIDRFHIQDVKTKNELLNFILKI